jgi:hypothetical protein
MGSRLGLLVSTVIGSVLSAVYWVVLFQAVYSLSATDSAPDLPQRDPGAMPLLVGLGGFALYVAAAWAWRSAELRWISGRSPPP